MSQQNLALEHGPRSTQSSDLIYIREVPKVFLQENFNLSNIETFNEVITSIDHPNLNDEQSSIKLGHSRRPPRILDREYLSQLQQKFTDYLDIIEDKLSSKISNRSGDFFQVMSSVHSVLDEISLAIKSVTNLRGKCSSLNESLVKPNLKKINLTVRRNNEQLTLQKLEEISKLCRIQPQIQLSISSSDHVGALDLIAKAKVMLHNDYKNVACLKHLESELVESERMAEEMIHLPGQIITIVKDVTDASLRGWEAKPPVPSDQFKEIVQYLIRLHKNIQDILPPNELKKLFYQIHHSFEETLLEHLRRLQIKSDAGPKQLVIRQELALFNASLKRMAVFNDWNCNYESLWKQLEPSTYSNSISDQ